MAPASEQHFRVTLCPIPKQIQAHCWPETSPSQGTHPCRQQCSSALPRVPQGQSQSLLTAPTLASSSVRSQSLLTAPTSHPTAGPKTPLHFINYSKLGNAMLGRGCREAEVQTGQKDSKDQGGYRAKSITAGSAQTQG